VILEKSQHRFQPHEKRGREGEGSKKKEEEQNNKANNRAPSLSLLDSFVSIASLSLSLSLPSFTSFFYNRGERQRDFELPKQ